MGFGMAIGAAAEFEKQIDHFSAVTGAPKEEIKAISDLALEMGRNTVFSANQAAGAMVELGKAGFNAKEILAGIGPAVASLAAAGDLPLTRATEILANTLRTFSLEAKDAVYVADQLAGAANASTIEVEDLAVSLRYAGAVASSLDIPLNEVADALAILGNNGIRGSTAGTTLRRVLLELNPATKKQADTLRELGIIQGGANLSAAQLATSQEKLTKANDGVAKAQQKVNDLMEDFAASGAPRTAAEATNRAQALRDANESLADAQESAKRQAEAHNLALTDQKNLFFDDQGNAKSLGEIFQILQDRTKNLNAAERQRIFDIIFGSRAVSGALILAKEGAQGFAEIAEQIGNVKAADVAAERLDNLSGAARRLKNVVETELIGVGTPLQGLLKGIVQGLTELVLWFGKLPEPIQTAFLAAVLLFGVLVGGVGGLLLLVSTISRTVRAFTELRALFVTTNIAKTALDRNVPILAGKLGFLTKAVQLLLAPFKLLYTLFMAVVGAIAAFLGVSAAVVLIVLAVIAILAILIIKVKAVREFFIRLGKAIWDFIQGIPGAFATAKDKVVEFFQGILHWGGQALASIGDFFGKIPGIVARGFSSALEAVGNFVAGVGNFLAQLPGMALNFLGQLLAAIGNFLVQLPERFLFAYGFLIGLWVRLWLFLLTHAVELITLIVTAIVGFFIDVFNKAVEWGPKIFDAIVDFFQRLPGRIIGFLDQAWEGFTAWADRMWDRAFKLGSDVLAAIVEWFQQLPGRIVSFLDEAWDRFTSWADRTWDRAWKLGSDVLSAIVEWFSQLPGRIGDFLSDAFNRVVNWAADTWNKAIEAGHNFFNGVVDGIRDLPGEVGKVLDRCIDAFLSVIGRAWDAAKRLAGALWNGFKAGLGISSPSFIERAMWSMVDNVQDSIKDLKGQIGKIQGMAMDLANPMSMNFNSPAAMEALRSQVNLITAQAGAVANGAQTTFYNEFHTDADPEQISQQIMWDQRVRVR